MTCAQHVYFAQRGPDGPIKIGVAINPKRRVSHLNTSSPERITLLGAVVGTAEKERRLHAELAPHRLNGEWFMPVPQVFFVLERELKSSPAPAQPFRRAPRSKFDRWLLQSGTSYVKAAEFLGVSDVSVARIAAGRQNICLRLISDITSLTGGAVTANDLLSDWAEANKGAA